MSSWYKPQAGTGAGPYQVQVKNPHKFRGLGDWGLGFGVFLWFRVWGLGLKVRSVGYRVRAYMPGYQLKYINLKPSISLYLGIQPCILYTPDTIHPKSPYNLVKL